MTKDINFQIQINGRAVNAPRNWQELEFLATYDNDSIQPNISTNSLVLVNEAYSYVMELFKSGQVFEGIPVKLSYSNSDVSNLNVFDGYIDLSNNFTYSNDKPEMSVNIVKNDALGSLSDRLSAIDYQYLMDKNIITDADFETIDYVVEKKYTPIEIAITLLTVYLLYKELYEAVLRLKKDIKNAVAHATGGATGGLAGAIFAIAVAVITLIYTAAILVLILNLSRDLFDLMIPPRRQTKVIKLRKLLEKPAFYLGYGFATGIPDVDNYYYLPSNKNFDDVNDFTGVFTKMKGTDKGIPSITDSGYDCLSMYGYLKDMFNAKFQVIDGVMQFRTADDEYWKNTAEYIKPTPLQRETSINADEIVSNRLISFATDITDDYTIDNYKGTSYQAHTKLKIKGANTTDLIKGFEDITIPFALGSRKEKLTPIENVLKDMFNVFDEVARTFGGKSDLAGKIKNKLGILRVSTNNWGVGKILNLQAGKLPTTHRNNLSAKHLYNNYWYERSFVLQNFNAQEKKTEGEEVPMQLNDFQKLLKNGYFSDANGRVLKAEKVVYNPFRNKAKFDYRLKEPYTTNLIETYYEPE